MPSLKKILFAAETFLTHIGLAILPAFPRRLLLACASAAGAVAWRLAPKMRRVALANLDVVFGDSLSTGEKRRIARLAFRTMAMVVLDLFWFSKLLEERVRRYVRVDPSLHKHIHTAPMIGITAHLGNWELLSKALGVHGFRHVAVAMPLENPGVDAIIGDERSVPGVEIVPRQGAVRALLRALRQKKHVALLLDKNTKPDEGGIFVNFFSLPIPMSTAAAVLSERSGAPIVPVFCRMEPDGSYIVYSMPPLELREEDTIPAVTQAIASLFEREIRAHPGQWLWMYKRWKYIFSPELAPRYPFYAKPLRGK